MVVVIGFAHRSVVDAGGESLAAADFEWLVMAAAGIALMWVAGPSRNSAPCRSCPRPARLNGQSSLRAFAMILPVHYWQDWADLFTPAGTARLGTGIALQIATIALPAGIAVLWLWRRDPAA
ncbi:hypothetical protein AB0C87_08705 [Actinomadura sp. NPDC048021]|uniref:hypothetical protein n=1 Tax=Actinomadura sp. NPDC048021 TaxID=3155385 RepID=UPI0033C1C31E